MAVRKLCLRLNDENPLHHEAWVKIEANGEGIQGYLLAAVLAYEQNPIGGLPEGDIDRIAERIASRLTQTKKVTESPAQAEPLRQEEPQMMEPKNEVTDDLVPESISGFLSGL